MNDPVLRAREKEIEARRDALLVEKRQHETQLTVIKNLVLSTRTMEHAKYKQCCDAQAKHVRAIAKIEEQLAPLKHQLRDLIVQEFEDRQVAYEVKAVETIKLKRTVQSLVNLRDKYQRFSADHTRISSMRQVSAEFCLALNEIIREAITKPDKAEEHAQIGNTR
jgi:FixJ family two-component response regulator